MSKQYLARGVKSTFMFEDQVLFEIAGEHIVKSHVKNAGKLDGESGRFATRARWTVRKQTESRR